MTTVLDVRDELTVVRRLVCAALMAASALPKGDRESMSELLTVIEDKIVDLDVDLHGLQGDDHADRSTD